MYGTPCDNNLTSVPTTDAKVDWVMRKSYRFKNTLSFSNVLSCDNNLPVLTQATENQINVESGAAVKFSKA